MLVMPVCDVWTRRQKSKPPVNEFHPCASVRVFARDMLDSCTGVNDPPFIAMGLRDRCSLLFRPRANCRLDGLGGGLLPVRDRIVPGGVDVRRNG